jgi:uncharacterized RDD family membrane protein YckC
MNCPSCRHGLPAGPNERCPFCGTHLSAPVEGALAAEPAPTPNPRDPQPLREIPGLRKRERTWKDEVRERVRERRERRSGELPLFDAAEPEPDAPAGDTDEELAREPAAAARIEPPDAEERVAGLADAPAASVGPHELGEPEADDLPLRPSPLADATARVETPPSADVTPVERPALPVERLMAGLVDLAILGGMWAAVVYFSSRVAGVPLSGLRTAWPWLAAYLGALGLLYAGYFTGTTGQTLGKMAHRLHVLHVSGGPPGHGRAVARALVGSLGVLLGGGGLLPMLFDPARRALHDRLLHTRVVRL